MGSLLSLQLLKRVSIFYGKGYVTYELGWMKRKASHSIVTEGVLSTMYNMSSIQCPLDQ